ncbi:SAV_2336 N-terminal domain-related protein [Streptomyces sp. PmtG]
MIRSPGCSPPSSTPCRPTATTRRSSRTSCGWRRPPRDTRRTPGPTIRTRRRRSPPRARSRRPPGSRRRPTPPTTPGSRTPTRARARGPATPATARTASTRTCPATRRMPRARRAPSPSRSPSRRAGRCPRPSNWGVPCARSCAASPGAAAWAWNLAATIDSYSRGGELLPVVAPLPEPWFDVLLVVDTHLTMEVWQGAVQEFATLLENSGAFRQVHRWQLSTEPHPDVTDARGRVVSSRGVAAPDGRRLVLVVSDCAAPAWYGSEVWQLLRDWAGHLSVSLASPLPSRLWHRTALDLPAVRVRSRLPGVPNTALAVTVPPHLRSVLSEDGTHVPVPTLSLTAHSLNRWARGMVRGSPEGYEAVLVAPFGAPDDPFAEAGEFAEAGAEQAAAPAGGPRHDGAGPAEAFIRTAAAPAVRLAGLCSAFRRLSLPLIQLIRQEVVPEATASDVAELLMSQVLDISAAPGAPQVISFRERARAPLARTAGRHDAWLVLDALSRHIAERVRLPGQGLNAIAALDAEELPEALRPFAYATDELVAALRVGAPRDRAAPGGAGPAEDDGPRPFLPDPLHSAALLIGAAPEDAAAHDEVAWALTELSMLLTSPDGWDLPAERCVCLIDAGADQVRAALRETAAMADEALLVWYVGHGPAIRAAHRDLGARHGRRVGAPRRAGGRPGHGAPGGGGGRLLGEAGRAPGRGAPAAGGGDVADVRARARRASRRPDPARAAGRRGRHAGGSRAARHRPPGGGGRPGRAGGLGPALHAHRTPRRRGARAGAQPGVGSPAAADRTGGVGAPDPDPGERGAAPGGAGRRAVGGGGGPHPPPHVPGLPDQTAPARPEPSGGRRGRHVRGRTDGVPQLVRGVRAPGSRVRPDVRGRERGDGHRGAR